MSERFIFGSVIGGGLLLGVCALIIYSVPVSTSTTYVNRQTGKMTYISTRHWIFTDDEGIEDGQVGASGFPGLTARDVEIKWREEKSFLWDVREPISLKHPEGDMMHELSYEFFGYPTLIRTMLPKESGMTKESVEKLIRERIPMWNSSEVDANPSAVFKRMQDENKEIFDLQGYLEKKRAKRGAEKEGR